FVRRLRKVSVSRSESVPKVAMVSPVYGERGGHAERSPRTAASAPGKVVDAAERRVELLLQGCLARALLGPYTEGGQQGRRQRRAEDVGADLVDPGAAGRAGDGGGDPGVTQSGVAQQLLLQPHGGGVAQSERERVRSETADHRLQRRSDAWSVGLRAQGR